VGCFAYSAVDGATANALPDPVPEAVKEARRARLMTLQSEISKRRLAAKVGRTLSVLVDGVEGRRVIARSSADAPEIDGNVYVNRARGARPGDLLTVRITRSGPHDLWGRPA
jgi:ribosomal protein S12 methylthiotransferase